MRTTEGQGGLEGSGVEEQGVEGEEEYQYNDDYQEY